MPSLLDTILCGLGTAAVGLETANNFAGLPGLGVAASILSQICDICEKAVERRQSFLQVREYAEDFRDLVVDKDKEGQQQGFHQDLDDLIERYMDDIIFVKNTCEEFSQMKWWRHAYQSRRTEAALNMCKQKLAAAKDKFNTESLKIIIRGQNRLQDGQEALLQYQAATHDRQTDQLTRDAEFKSGQDLLLSRTVDISTALHDGFVALEQERIERWIEKNPGATREVLSPEKANSLAQLPAEEQAQYRQFVAALIEAGAGAVTDLNGIIVRGDEVEPGTPVWIGHLKVKDVKMPQKFWVRRIDVRVASEDMDTDSKNMRRLREEMRVTVAIRHVNIMRLYGMFIDVADGPYAFVAYMYEAYVLLDRYLNENSDEHPMGILSGVASGLAHLHEATRPLIHGDVRCSKIAVTPDGTAKIFDFTLAVVIQEVTDNQYPVTRVTRDVSLWWGAPEVLIKEEVPAASSDVWSFGITMIECLSIQEALSRDEDRHPFPWFRGISPFMNFYLKVVDGSRSFSYDPRPQSAYAQRWGELPVWDLIFSCLSVAPDDRPSMKQVESRLRTICL